MKKVTKVIIPAAGYGTRFLPQTKAMPKEMLPVVDKPVIQYVVEEAVASGIEDIIIVTGPSKRAIEDHFDRTYDVEYFLEKVGKREQLEEIRKLAKLANFIYVRQKGPYGTAIPIRTAKHLVENEPFLVLWGDDFIYSDPPRAAQMIDVYEKFGGSVLSAIRTSKEEDKNKYGFLEGPKVDERVIQVKKLREKPGPSYTASDLASVSGFLLTPQIIPIIENLKPGKGGELWLADAISELAVKEKVYGVEIKNGTYYDTGNKLGYLKTVVDFAISNPEFGKEFVDYLEEKVKKPKGT
ncbi:MAG TPA: UTP--glucose-1-phosphate uridylyltransferase [Candidatus Nanoarchaeia archaeon]